MRISLLLLVACSIACANGNVRSAGLTNLAEGVDIEASSSSGRPGAKYGPDSANDGDMNTWWASGGFPRFPVTLTLTFPEPTTLDTVVFVQPRSPNLYSNWKAVRVELSDGTSVEEELEDSSAPRILRFDRREVEWMRLVILEPHDPERHYIGLREVMAFNDPERKVGIKMPPAEMWKQADLTPRGRAEHPCVYITPDDVARARERLATEEWAQRWFEGVRRQADEWVARDDEWIADIVPEHGSAFAYGFTGCPICRASWGRWGGARASFDNPGHVTCGGGHVLPDDDHPDPGTGYVGPDGRIHYFVGSYNAWVVETLQFRALRNLALAFTLTGEEQYAQKAAFILDALADIYPSCDAGSWDYPSTPPSGRFNRPWYQVARVLVHFVDWYDQIYNSPSLDEPSVREGMTRRENIEINLMQNGAEYCYTESFKGGLHNGQADYVRGSLAVGCLLDIPHYIDWAYDGPYGILSLVRNNVDRDGRYFETSVSYANHTRSLYMTFAEPLINYRSEQYPEGINLYDDAQFQSFYVLPDLGFNCIGKSPRFGDSGPDTGRSFLPSHLTSDFDYRLAERLFSRTGEAEARAQFGALLMHLSDGDPVRARQTRGERPWVLFHGRDLDEMAAAPAGDLPESLARRISQTEFFGQKGMAFLRTGGGADAQAALIRYGPSLNHGHLDDLNLNYYALGYEVTYDLGFGLGSTHTQVGWARQTASHNLVLVDETSQRTAGSGTGGSLHLLADFPGLQITEVSSDNSYAQQGVSTYRRLLALVGEGPETYLVDLFRVEGGAQHDYLFHALGDEAQFEGVTLGEPEEGSLAGPEFRWGALQLNDGDMQGYPNRPYWNPPPRNGLGFLMEPQRAVADGPWRATWTLPSNDAFVQLVMPPQPDTEVITAHAPGLYPHHPRARYALARRKAAGDAALSSVFTAVIAPFGESMDGARMDAAHIQRTGAMSAGEVMHITGLGTLLFKGAARDDELTWPFTVPETGEYMIAVEHYRSPLYGHAQLLVNGAQVGEALEGTHGDVQQAPLARLGTLQLEAGEHTATLRLVADDGAGNFWFGIRALWLIPAERAETTVARSPIREVLRAACDDDEGPVRPAGALVTLEPDGSTADLLLSAGDAERRREFRAGPHEVALRGRFAHVRFVNGQPVAINLVGVAELHLGALHVRCAAAEHSGTVQFVDEGRAVVDVDAPLPDPERLAGQVILFDNPRYSRSTAHRIARVEPRGDGARIHLESSTLVLGSGVLDDDPLSTTQFTSLLAHEYARHDSVTGTQFFSGKRIKGDGFTTIIEGTSFGQLMRYTVDSTEGMAEGEEFIICDVQAGDTFVIPTTARLVRGPDGTLTVAPESTTNATVE